MTLEKASIMITIPVKRQGCLKQEISSTMKLFTTTLMSSLMITLLSYWDYAMGRKSDAIQSETWNIGIKRVEVVRFHIFRKRSRTQKLQRSDCRWSTSQSRNEWESRNHQWHFRAWFVTSCWEDDCASSLQRHRRLQSQLKIQQS